MQSAFQLGRAYGVKYQACALTDLYQVAAC